MASTIQPRPESERIEFLLRRDGLEATRAWVERTLGIYREALSNPKGQASDPTYKPRFEKAVREFEEWLAERESRGVSSGEASATAAKGLSKEATRHDAAAAANPVRRGRL